LGNKRQVLDAVWDQQPVILKLFTSTTKAKYHAVREWRALKLLQERELNSPAPLFYGKTDQSNWAVVIEKIVDAQNVRKVWDNTADAAGKCDLLCKVARELVKQHCKGVLQKDLHLGNFLLKDQEVLALDASEMRFRPHEVNKKQTITQLASLASAWPDEDTDSAIRICEEYAQARSWKFSPFDLALFRKKMALSRKTAVQKALKKCLRTSKGHQRIEQGSYCGVATRDFFEKADFAKFVEDVDQLMQSGQILKSGNTCFVSRINWAGEDVVVKRYNHKGIMHTVRHTIKRSRARRSWLHAHRLGMLNVATPRPLAYLEHCKSRLVWKSYFVTKYVEGQRLYVFLRDSNVTKQQRSTVTTQIGALLAKLEKHRISHGDLKHSNILITESGPVLTDLDAMITHRWNCMYKTRRAKDMASLATLSE
jgi:tRNA A-37 threonylcarbamoyl transferase component Bud32